jgi:hypothetical protein
VPDGLVAAAVNRQNVDNSALGTAWDTVPAGSGSVGVSQSGTETAASTTIRAVGVFLTAADTGSALESSVSVRLGGLVLAVWRKTCVERPARTTASDTEVVTRRNVAAFQGGPVSAAAKLRRVEDVQ